MSLVNVRGMKMENDCFGSVTASRRSHKVEVFSAGTGPPSVREGGGLRLLPFPLKTGWFPSFLRDHRLEF